MRKGVTTVGIDCPEPECEHGPIEVRVAFADDPGVRWHADGSGTPPSFDWEVQDYPTTCPGGHPVTAEWIDQQVEQSGEVGTADDEDDGADIAYDLRNDR